MTRSIKTVSLLLAIILLLSFASCNWITRIADTDDGRAVQHRGFSDEDSDAFAKIPQPGFHYSAAYEPVTSRYSYEALTDDQKALYDGLESNIRQVAFEKDEQELYRIPQVIVEDCCLNAADIRLTIKAYLDDNPYVFWLSGTCARLTFREENYTAVRFYSDFAPDEIITMQEETDAALDDFFDGIPGDLSAYEREKYTHNYIVEICDYDDEAAQKHTQEEKIIEANLPYGVMVKHQAVCEGYGKTFQLLMNGLGVNCVGITGIGVASDEEQELHLWNAVELDDGWYHIDVTWDDQENSYFQYDYFNLNDEQIAEDHIASALASTLTDSEINGEATYGAVAMNLYVPACSGADYNYYTYDCPHLTDYDGYEVKDALYQAALDQDVYFTIYIDPAYLDYDDAIYWLFKESPQYIFEYIGYVNDQLYDYEIDTGNLTYYQNEKRSTVTVKLNYY